VLLVGCQDYRVDIDAYDSADCVVKCRAEMLSRWCMTSEMLISSSNSWSTIDGVIVEGSNNSGLKCPCLLWDCFN